MPCDYKNTKPIIAMKDIKKEFSGVWALSGITFEVYPGEIHCLVGENGAGKSTLMKVLSGAYTPTEGTITVDGKEYSKFDPFLSKQLGINIVYQENDLVPSMDVVENIFVGNEKTNGLGIIDYPAMRKEIVIALIVVIISCINPNFIGINNIVAIFQQICVLGILTMAMSILLISGGIDLSIGNIMVVCGVVMYVVLDNGLPTFIAVLAGLVTGAACGLLNGAIIAKSKCIPLVITLGTSKMFYGIALTVSGGRIMNFGGALNGLKTKYFEIFSPMLLVLLAMVMVAYLMMTYTKFGRRVVALGGNEKNAFLSGINVNRYKIIVYGISGLFCAVASIVFVARIDSITSNAGTNYETNALAAAIIGGVTFDGGKGTISGAFLGCLLMGVISNAMNILGVDNNVQTIITGAIIVAAVVLSNINNIKKK